jgi:hypothetical protein
MSKNQFSDYSKNSAEKRKKNPGAIKALRSILVFSGEPLSRKFQTSASPLDALIAQRIRTCKAKNKKIINILKYQ